MIGHTVAFRLVHPLGSPAEADFLAAARALAGVPGVRDFEQLREVSPKNAFTHAFTMAFTDEAAYAAYDAHPVHVAFVHDRWVDEVAEFVEVDVAPLA